MQDPRGLHGRMVILREAVTSARPCGLPFGLQGSFSDSREWSSDSREFHPERLGSLRLPPDCEGEFFGSPGSWPDGRGSFSGSLQLRDLTYVSYLNLLGMHAVHGDRRSVLCGRRAQVRL